MDSSPDADVEKGEARNRRPSGDKYLNNADGDAAGASTRFGVSADELVQLVQECSLDELQRLGGADGLAEKLRVDRRRGIPAPAEGTAAATVAAATAPGGRGRAAAAAAATVSGGGDFAERVRAFGANRFRYPPPKSFLRLCWEAWNDLILMILTVAAVVSLAIGIGLPEERANFGYLEGCAIIIVVLFVVLLQAFEDLSKERKFRQLNSVKDAYEVNVLRDGSVLAEIADHVVVGDVVKISAGNKLPGDGVLIDASNLKCDEAAMTGEPIDVDKTPVSEVDFEGGAGDPFLLSGTVVTDGVGYMLVLAVGERSQWGLILAGLVVEPDRTPLQVRLDRLAMFVGYVGIAFAVAVFVVLMVRWIVESSQEGEWHGVEVIEFVIAAIAIIVVAIPEGLPLAITLSLAFAMRQMMRDNNLVRRLEACETMGSATQLNADKTGTLTMNRMTVVRALLGGERFDDAPRAARARDGPDADAGGESEAFRDLLCVSIAVNSQADLAQQADGTVDHIGSKTECALLQMVENLGYRYRELRNKHAPSKVFLFNSMKKRMSSTEDVHGDGSVQRMYTKGASEIMLGLCTREMDAASGQVRPLSDAVRDTYSAAIDEFASDGLRTLCLAYRDVEHDIRDQEFWKEPPESDLTLLALVGIKDPVRPETPGAVELLRSAGVTVRMVTGDNALTARFIAIECKLLDADAPESEAASAVIEGPALRKLSEEELIKIANDIRVVARASPQDKLLLCAAQRKLGEVVAVTGDGTNDAPALKEADVGFGMGISGTEVAKESCDIVILDDNIASMAKAVLWGRNVFDSIRKFLQFQLVVNVVAVLLNFVSACAGRELPLSAVPLLWVNMIMDSMGALALATEPPREELMHRKPFGRRAPLINKAMYRNLIGVSTYQLTVSLVLLFAGNRLFGIPCFTVETMPDVACSGQILQRNSIIFNTFVFMQVFNEINSRRIEQRDVFSRIGKSRIFIAIVVVTVLLQVALIEGVGRTTVGMSIGFANLSWNQWLASVIIGMVVLPYGVLVRFWPLRWTPGRYDDEEAADAEMAERLYEVPKSQRQFHKYAEEDEGGVLALHRPLPFAEYENLPAERRARAPLSTESAIVTEVPDEEEQEPEAEVAAATAETASTVPPVETEAALRRLPPDVVRNERIRRLRVFVHATVAMHRMHRSAQERVANYEGARDAAGAAATRSSPSRRRMRVSAWALISLTRMQRGVTRRAAHQRRARGLTQSTRASASPSAVGGSGRHGERDVDAGPERQAE